jgi:hypothetical protein
MSYDTEQLSQDLEVCEFFIFQLDESIDVYDVSQLLVSIGMVFKDNSTKGGAVESNTFKWDD